MPAVHELLEAGHLANSQCRRDVGHPVVEAERNLLVVPDLVGGARIHRFPLGCDPVTAVEPHRLGERGVVGHRHAPLARGDDLHRMEAEDRDVTVATIPHRLARIRRADGMRRVFDDPESVALREISVELHNDTVFKIILKSYI